MSGQPYKTKIDMVKARDAYLANLKLRAELDDKNLQANKVYKSTGQLPVVPPDTRTLTEKLADVERLKLDIRGRLSNITDGIEANKIVEGLSPDQLTFLAQNIQPIEEQMKQRYSLGVPAPIFIDYLNRYINRFNITKGVELGLQQSAGNRLLANQQIIMSNMASKRDVIEIEDILGRLGQQNTTLGKSLMTNLSQLQEILEYLPETFVELNKAENSIQQSQIQKLLNDIVNDLPTKQDLSQSLSQLRTMIQTKNTQGINSVLRRIDSLVGSGSDIREELEVLKKLVGEVKTEQVSERESGAKGEVPVATIVGGPVSLLPIEEQILSLYKNQTDASKLTAKQRKEYIEKAFEYIRDSGMSEGRTDVNKYVKFINKTDTPLTRLNKSDELKVIGIMNALLRDIGQLPESQVGRGMKGRGVVVHRIRPSQVLEGDVDYNFGIDESAKFVPIGRYLINKRQLDKDIIAIKRPAGSPISTLPSQRVSRKVGSILRKVIGGSLPTFEDINNLDDEERVYLYKVSKETRIDDKLTLPSPKKDEDEKDINQFEILRGQILAGNDNTEVVKKFKMILLKLSRKDLIPKSQVKDLLLDLTTLGH